MNISSICMKKNLQVERILISMPGFARRVVLTQRQKEKLTIGSLKQDNQPNFNACNSQSNHRNTSAIYLRIALFFALNSIFICFAFKMRCKNVFTSVLFLTNRLLDTIFVLTKILSSQAIELYYFKMDVIVKWQSYNFALRLFDYFETTCMI